VVNAPALQVTDFVLAAPVGSATALQPLIVVPPSVNATVPVGATPLTFAVKVTLIPTVAGSAELEALVVLAVLLFTCCDKAALTEPPLDESPLYVATTL
jgi:hypothetical protein